MIEVKQTEAFRLWESRLKDRRARTLIAARITRLTSGLLGDVEPIGEGISELRIHYGPGYRIYFQQKDTFLIILLCAGNKKTQSRDIEIAKKLAKEWSE